jgi:hypothetical protein
VANDEGRPGKGGPRTSATKLGTSVAGERPARFDVERAVLAADLPALSKYVLLVLLVHADATTLDTGRYSPSLTALTGRTGLDRKTVRSHLDRLERDGWIERRRPSVQDARTTHAKTRYVIRDRARGSDPLGLGAEIPQARSTDPPGKGTTSPRARGSDPLISSSSQSDQSSSQTSEIAPRSDAPRPDVDRLCDHLADRIEGNGSKRPTITKKWRDAARLMLDKDDRTEEQVHAAIDWCQSDEFWRANVLSMPKLREKYDQLSLQAQRCGGGSPNRGLTGTDARVAGWLNLAAGLDQGNP